MNLFLLMNRLRGVFLKRYIKQGIKNKRLGIKFLIFLIVLIFIPLVLNIFFVYKRVISTIESEEMRNIDHLVVKSTQSMNLTIDNIERNIYKLTKDMSIIGSLKRYNSLDKIYQDKVRIHVENKLQDIISNDYYIDNVSIITDSGNTFSAGKNSKDVFLEDVYIDRLNKIDKGDINWDLITKKNNGFKDCILVSKSLNISEHNSIGYIFIFIDSQKFTKLYEDIVYSDFRDINLYDKDFNVLFDDTNISIPKEKLKNNLIKYGGNQSEIITINGLNYSINVQNIPRIDAFIVGVASLEGLSSPVKNSLIGTFWIMFIITVIISIGIITQSVLLSKTMTQKKMGEYRLKLSEDTNQKLRIYKHDFMNHLQIIRSLLDMDCKDRIEEYIENLVDEGRGIKNNYQIGIPEIESTIYSAIASAEKYDIETRIDAIELPEELHINIYDLVKILTNLIKNAIYALANANDQEKILYIKIYWELDEYIFEIVNSVPTISQEIRRKIFNKGFTTKGKHGDGLGLYIVKKLVKKNGGRMELKIDEIGNHFIIRFPGY